MQFSSVFVKIVFGGQTSHCLLVGDEFIVAMKSLKGLRTSVCKLLLAIRGLFLQTAFLSSVVTDYACVKVAETQSSNLIYALSSLKRGLFSPKVHQFNLQCAQETGGRKAIYMHIC